MKHREDISRLRKRGTALHGGRGVDIISPVILQSPWDINGETENGNANVAKKAPRNRAQRQLRTDQTEHWTVDLRL